MAGPITSSKQTMLGTQAYRKVLAAAPDGSVNIASIGMPTNLRDLLATKADNYSSMNGYDLVAAKVRLSLTALGLAHAWLGLRGCL